MSDDDDRTDTPPLQIAAVVMLALLLVVMTYNTVITHSSIKNGQSTNCAYAVFSSDVTKDTGTLTWDALSPQQREIADANGCEVTGR